MIDRPSPTARRCRVPGTNEVRVDIPVFIQDQTADDDKCLLFSRPETKLQHVLQEQNG